MTAMDAPSLVIKVDVRFRREPELDVAILELHRPIVEGLMLSEQFNFGDNIAEIGLDAQDLKTTGGNPGTAF